MKRGCNRKVRVQRRAQRVFTKNDHMVQTVTADRTDDAFDVSSLPRRSRSAEHFFELLMLIRSRRLAPNLTWGGARASPSGSKPSALLLITSINKEVGRPILALHYRREPSGGGPCPARKSMDSISPLASCAGGMLPKRASGMRTPPREISPIIGSSERCSEPRLSSGSHRSTKGVRNVRW